MKNWALIEMILIGVLTAFSLSLAVSNQTNTQITVNVTLDGKPADALIKVLQEDKIKGAFYTDVNTVGQTSFALAPGDYTFIVEHGAGFVSLPKSISIKVEPDKALNVNVALERLFEPNSWGYYSADLHAHTIASAAAMWRDFTIPNHGVTPVDQVVAVQLAADLDVMFISDHNSVDGHELFAQTSQKRGVPFILSEEITTIRWGHFNPYSLKKGQGVEYTPFKEPGQYFKEARERGAQIIQVNHPFSPVGGYFYSMNNPSFDDSFDAIEVFNGDFGDDDARTVQRIFEFWNQGKKYIATAVSDDHDWKKLDDQYGTPRTYVFVQGELTAEKFIEALKQQHAFVTYGPMMNFTAQGNAIPGDTVQLKSGDSVALKAELKSVTPLKQAQIIRNAEVIKEFSLSATEAVISFADKPDANSWYAVRVVAEGGAQALTNPIWVVSK